MLLALLVPAAVAQSPPDEPYTSIVDNSAYLGNAPIRVWHRTRGYGEETAETAFGTHWAMPMGVEGVGFIDGQFRLGNSDTDFSLNAGAGYRWRADDYFTGDPRILGVSFWYDGEDTQNDNFFNQLGFSLERLGPLVDLRLNGNFPVEDAKDGDDAVLTGGTTFFGNQLGQTTLIPVDVPLRVVDFEVAPRLFNLNAWAYGGGYQIDGDGVSETGWKAGGRGYVTNDLALDVGVTDDEHFGTNTVVQIIWTPGRTGSTMSSWQHTIDDRMREQVFRNAYVAIDRQTRTGAEALTDEDGQAFNIVHVDSSAAPGGDGSFERPFDELTDVQPNTDPGDIILVHANSSFTGENATIQDAQRFLGEGNNVTHTVVTSELGSITLPETFAGALAAARPIINNAPGAGAIILAGANDDVDTVAGIEISNFQVNGGTSAIVSPTGVGQVNINNMAINGTTSHGINLSPLTETLTNGTTRQRFQPVIDEVDFTGVGGDDIRLTSVTAPAATTILESTTITDYTSDDGEGVGINLINLQRAATITNIDWDGGTTGIGALRFQDGIAQSTATVNGTNTITGGVTGVAGQGFAIALINGSANHTVTGTTITNTGGDSIIASGGTANMNFTGRIDQTANNASILSAENGHDGNLVFTELTANAGVINATTGDGLQFNNADGVYTFNDNVRLVGTAAAVTAVNDSSAVITIADGTITNTTGDSLVFDGGSANMTFTGQISQTANNASILSVANGHTGTLAFNELTANAGVINATTGDGLQFDNADGAYNFNDKVTLNGSAGNIDTGVDVLNGSAGTFSFTQVDIDYANAAGSAVRINASAPQSFSMAGDITTTAGRPVELSANTGGSVAISATINGNAGSNGILIQNNTGGTNSFSGAVTLNTGALAAVSITGNTAGSTSFNNLDITTTSGDAYSVINSTGHTVTVTGNDNTIATTTGIGIHMNNATVGAGNVNFRSVSVNGASNGILLNNVVGGSVIVGVGGASPGDGGTIQNTTGDGVEVTNANVSLNNMIVTGTAAGFNGIEINHTNAVAHTASIIGSQITNTGAMGIDVNRAGTGTFTLTLNNNTINTTTDEGVGIDVSGSGTTNLTIAANTIDNSSNDSALLVTTTGGVAKTINMLVNQNNISNNDATEPAANFQANGTGVWNSTITSNNFTNSGAAPGPAFEMASNAAASTIRLNLNANTASGNGTNDYFLEENAGTFSVQDLATVQARNTGTVNTTGTIDNDAGPIPTP